MERMIFAILICFSTGLLAQEKKPLPIVSAFGVTKMALDPSVVAQIKATPAVNAYGITGYQRIPGQIIKAESITINSKAFAQFERTDVPFVAIVAKDLYIEIPATNEDAAKISRPPDNAFPVQHGTPGSPGVNGNSPGGESGDNGGKGVDGAPGGNAGVTKVPDIYIFFNRIITSAGNPSTAGLFKVISNGVPGGNGGTGGRGGNGGAGSTGTPASCSLITCTAGPGIGGNGGQAGSGGRGGNAGNGGRGGNVYLVGPQSQFAVAAFTQIYQEGSEAGSPGAPGAAGSGGAPGGGGRMCTYCNGRDPGSWGPGASPRDYGFGSNGARGERGDRALIDRNNSDLF